jgi:glycosyltransferase involved in cell wall biosynthesis
VKILHLLASPGFTGPAETVTQLALAQRALGHEVTVAVDRKRTSLSSEEPIVPRLEAHHLLDGRGLQLSVKSTPWAMAKDVLSLRAAAVDVIHSHFSHDHTLARLGRPRGARLIRSIHAPRSLRWATPKADGYTVPMEGLGRKLLGQRVLVLPALVGPEFRPPVTKTDTKTKQIGMVSSFQPSRRHALGIEAFLALRQRGDGALTLIGDGALEPELRKQAEPAGSAISFGGYHSGDAFIARLQQLDEVWILGLGNDWSARAAAQARACGVRVLAVDEGDLARYADVVVEPTVEAITAASQSTERRDVQLESPASVAQRVVAFYERC